MYINTAGRGAINLTGSKVNSKGDQTMAHTTQERDAKLLPVAVAIFACYVCIVVGGYLVAQLF
jgi:predicted HNH restriction endonuclease